MSPLVEPFAHDTDFFTEFGNDGVNAKFRWTSGRLELTKLKKGWNLAGLVQSEAFMLYAGVKTELVIKLVTNTVGNQNASDNNSSTLLNWQASSTGLPTIPDLSINTYGFCVAGGKAGWQDSFGGNGTGDDMSAGETYTITQEILANTGYLKISVDGGDFSGTFHTIESDFRGLAARANFQPYFTDTLFFKEFKLTLP